MPFPAMSARQKKKKTDHHGLPVSICFLFVEMAKEYLVPLWANHVLILSQDQSWLVQLTDGSRGKVQWNLNNEIFCCDIELVW